MTMINTKFKVYKNTLTGEIRCETSKVRAWNYFWTKAKLKGADQLPRMEDINLIEKNNDKN